MAVFNVEKPKYFNWHWTSIVARVFFPPILLWDLFKFLINKWLGNFIGEIILPAQHVSSYSLPLQYSYSLDAPPTLTIEKHKVVTFDGAQLDTVEIKSKAQEKLAAKHQKYIINFLGNGEIFEAYLDNMKADAQALNANVIGFNFRGVLNSTGKPKSKDDLVIDGIAQVQRLLNQGVSPQNITLKGHSLGAGIASLVARYFHQQDQPINIFNGRSFSTLTNVLVGIIRGEERGGATLGSKILGWIAKPFIKLALALTKWEINADDAFKALPKTHREYMVVRPRKAVRGFAPGDGVIPHYASMYAALKSERAAGDAKEVKEQNKNRRMEAANSPLIPGHNENMQNLVSRNHGNGAAFFRKFAANTWKDHGVNAPAQAVVK